MAENKGLQRFSGMYGSAWRSGAMLGDVSEFSGAVDVNVIEVPIPGSPDSGYKPGPVSRDGTLRVQKIDSYWEMEIYQFLSQSLDTRRAMRDAGQPRIRTFDLMVRHDDPDTLGVEVWAFYGCTIWRLPLGFSRGDDITEREYPVRWEREEPLQAFKAVPGERGTLVAQPYDLAALR